MYIILLLLLFLLLVFFLKRKHLKVPCVYLVTGAVKTGKSFLSCSIAVKQYKKNLLKYYIQRYLFFNKNVEKPMLFSNIPLSNIKYNDLTLDIIERNVRIPYKSVVFIDEASLLADNFSYDDKLINEKITLFIKLFGHYSKGGSLIYNTQDLKDMHYAFKRCTSNFLFIHSRIKLPFFTILNVREMISITDDDVSSVTNNVNDDIEKSTIRLFVSNKYYKYYDCFCYSSLTDNKKVVVDYQQPINKKRTKTNYILSFKKFKSFNNERVERNEINS